MNLPTQATRAWLEQVREAQAQALRDRKGYYEFSYSAIDDYIQKLRGLGIPECSLQ